MNNINMQIPVDFIACNQACKHDSILSIHLKPIAEIIQIV